MVCQDTLVHCGSSKNVPALPGFPTSLVLCGGIDPWLCWPCTKARSGPRYACLTWRRDQTLHGGWLHVHNWAPAEPALCAGIRPQLGKKCATGIKSVRNTALYNAANSSVDRLLIFLSHTRLVVPGLLFTKPKPV